ncbi:MAG: lysine transporter LysE [Desulfobacteraceae bacterium 4572_88]|nr:MAG: lysine transporter LysE [Desulfobacteraceae bacterium 4572_88]
MNIEIFSLISFVIVTTFTPGPNNISSASMGVMYGYRKTFNYLLGITFGFFLVMIACAYLSSTLLRIMPVAEQYLRWAGAGYILWLAIGILNSDYSVSESDELPKAFTKGFILQLFNPKGAVYGLTLYSTFLASISDRPDYLLLSAVSFALTAFVAISAWALFGAVIKKKLKNDAFRKIINVFLSVLLIYTAIELSGVLSLFGNG